MTSKIHNYTLNRRTLSVFFVTIMSLSVWATDYITDVKVFGGNVLDIGTIKVRYIGWNVVSKDLNAGTNGDVIYLMYKTSSSNDSEVITDFYLLKGNNAPASLTHEGRTYYLTSCDGSINFVNSDGDLNRGAGGDYIHLYYTKDDFLDGRAVSGVTFNTTQSGAVGMNGGSTGYDLNKGAGGDYIYMHFTTQKIPTTGIGTKADPYVIHNLAGWNELASNVSNDKTYSGQYIKLGRNIKGVTTMVGHESKKFRGNLDGNGKTLNVNISSTSSNSSYGIAPFGYIYDATIQDLTVKGSVISGRETASGFVGVCGGTSNLIKGCTVETMVSCPTYAGGLVGPSGGLITDAVTIEDCVFSGTLSISDNGGFAGGMIGWCNTLTFTINNCLFKGTFSGSGNFHPIDCCKSGDRATGQVADTYYLNTTDISNFPADHIVPHTDGTAVSQTLVDELWAIPVTAADGKTYYKSGSPTLADVLVQLPENAVIQSNWTIEGIYYTSNIDLPITDTPTEVVFDGNDVYIKGLALRCPNSWVKGTVTGNTVTFATGQYMGKDENGKYYLTGFNGSDFVDIEFSYNDVVNVFTLTTPRLSESPSRNSLMAWGYYKSLSLIGSADSSNELVKVPDGIEIETDWVLEGSYLIQNSISLSINKTTEVAFDGNDIYIKGLSNFCPDAWLKGTINGNTATFLYGQYMGGNESKNVYLMGINKDYMFSDIVFSYDSESKTFTLTTPLLCEAFDRNSLDFQTYFANVKVYEGELSTILPEGLETKKYIWTGNDVVLYFYNEPQSKSFIKFITVAIDGNDVYVQGISKKLPSAWAKGTISGNTVTFPQGQFLGNNGMAGHYLVGLKDNEVCDVTFTFDKATQSFTSNTWMADNGNKFKISSWLDYYTIYSDNVWKPFNEVAGVPSNPSFDSVEMQMFEDLYLISSHPIIPVVDVNGNMMNINKLYYRLYSDINGEIQPVVFDKDFYNSFFSPIFDTIQKYGLEVPSFSETLEEIPYTFSCIVIGEGGSQVSILQDDDAIDRLGIQTIYYGGLEEGEPGKTSDIVWYSLKDYGITTGVTDNNADNGNDSWYSINGTKLLEHPKKKGIYIHKGKKVVVK